MSLERWYAIHCKSRHEKQVHLRLQMKGIASYLAEFETRVKWGTRMRKTHKNLLPGYVLVHAEMDPARHLAVLQTESVVKFVGKPWPHLSWIPDHEIESLQMVLDYRMDFEQVDYLTSGQPVEVIAGPFAGLRGLVQEHSPRPHRVYVSLHLLKRTVAVEIDTQLLRKVERLRRRRAA